MIIDIPNSGTIELDILPIDHTRPHEDTIPELLASVKTDVSRTGFQRDPILVDRKTGMVLDGMHRREALVQLGAKYVVCTLLDYESENVSLSRWLRYFVAPPKKMLGELIELFDLMQVTSLKEAMSSVDKTPGLISLLSNRTCYLGEEKMDPELLYEKIKESDMIARSNSVEVQVIRESERFDVFSSEAVYVIYPPPLRKEDVVKIALNGSLLPFKTTRHTVRVRPMGVHFPITGLIEKGLAENQRDLKELTDSARIEMAEKETWYEGRKYAEPLAIFRRKGV